jgi:reactive chlorine resistance protein C
MSRTFVTDVSRGIPVSRPIHLSRHASAIARLLPLNETLVRYTLVVIFLWFGAMKFTDYEAAGTARWIMDSPLVGWWHTLLGIKGTSIMLGIFELTVAVLLLMRPFSSRLAAVGAGMGSSSSS